MHRSVVTLRCAEPADAPMLADLWADALRRADKHDQVADVELVIKTAAQSPEQRIVVAEYDGNPAGAVLLRVSTLNPLNPDLTVQALSPHVLPKYRRHGVGRALMEAAVTFAEEQGVGHVATAATSGSRDANRFMARLGLGPQAVLRVASTHALRARLTALRPAHERGGRQLTQVLAARRSQRRSQAAG
ncbi:GNAT family N-acetyltransferase [Nocardioides sp. zg-578]|uniref:GNAT family N-acetyltransferase n=2 Tax=Nocardioides marmotae TaxID=2663857 RepID=UPI0012B61357|nr:GNAT family N-acetyltransferase [Nocardioides marmotae]MBC9732038.1 GNAT family N-acetyltransferase [Nocardioides marmotae]QKE01071.1 GNAT family N-acetyltransferase [Nocardioides marmotae]